MKFFDFFSRAVSTFFYCGYFPVFPGTFTSALVVFLFYCFKMSGFFWLAAVLILAVLGLVTSGRTEKLCGKTDPSCVVIDEVCGMLLSLLFLPFDIRVFFLAFILFRVFDVLKPFPLKRLQSLKGGLGIILDDIGAGLYTNLTLQIALRIISFKGS